MKSSLIVLCFVLGVFTQNASATSRIYSSIDKLIASSDIIVVVSIDKSNDKSRIDRAKSTPFRYADSAQILTTVKGNTPDSFLIYHASGFDDCLFQQGPSEYLVFLKRQDEKYVPTDGWPSSKLIENDQVAGWSDTHQFGKDFERLQTVIEYIKEKSLSERST